MLQKEFKMIVFLKKLKMHFGETKITIFHEKTSIIRK